MAEKLYEGYHEELPFKRGDRVRVKKGARLISTHPKKPEPYQAYRSQVVTVHHTMPGQSYSHVTITERERHWLEAKGYSPELEEMDKLYEEERLEEWRAFRIHTQNPRVVWVGTGHYWVEADINDVEPLESDDDQDKADETS